MKIKTLVLVITALLTLSGSLSLAANGPADGDKPECSQQLLGGIANTPDNPLIKVNGIIDKLPLSPEFSKLLYLLSDITGVNTTSLRAELKATVNHKKLDEYWNELVSSLPGQVQARDKVEEGWQNMTMTRYLQPMKYEFHNYSYEKKEHKGSVRLRFRKYFQKHIESGDVRVAPITDGKSFLEFKITNPGETEGLVVKTKHRVLVFDKDFRKFLDTGGKRKSVRAMMKNAYRIDGNNSHRARQSLRLFEALFFQLRDELGAENIKEAKGIAYTRKAFSINLESSDPTLNPIDVQVTIDNDIDLLSPERVLITSYPKEVRVLEVKIPVEFAGLQEKDFMLYPGLRDVAKFLKQAMDNSDPRFTINHGKFYHSQRMPVE